MRCVSNPIFAPAAGCKGTRTQCSDGFVDVPQTPVLSGLLSSVAPGLHQIAAAPAMMVEAIYLGLVIDNLVLIAAFALLRPRLTWVCRIPLCLNALALVATRPRLAARPAPVAPGRRSSNGSAQPRSDSHSRMHLPCAASSQDHTPPATSHTTMAGSAPALFRPLSYCPFRATSHNAPNAECRIFRILKAQGTTSTVLRRRAQLARLSPPLVCWLPRYPV